MRIFVSPLAAGELTLRGDEHHYLSRVRRAKAGDTIDLLDGEGLRASAEVLSVGPEATTLRVGHVQQLADRPPRIRALLPLIKGDRMDTAIEKLVETGVDEIVVWPAARAVVKLDNERRTSRIEHYQSIAQAAARQSGRASIPNLTWADSLANAIAGLPETNPPDVRLVLDPAADRADLRALLARPASTLPFDHNDARAFDESTEIAVTGRFQRPDITKDPEPPPATESESITSTGRFVRMKGEAAETADWPLAQDPSNPGFVDHVTIVTGPEGGLAPAEIDALTAARFTAIGLGPRVLRAETAPSIAVALVRTLTDS